MHGVMSALGRLLPFVNWNTEEVTCNTWSEDTTLVQNKEFQTLSFASALIVTIYEC